MFNTARRAPARMPTRARKTRRPICGIACGIKANDHEGFHARNRRARGAMRLLEREEARRPRRVALQRVLGGEPPSPRRQAERARLAPPCGSAGYMAF